jgi:hypothetical protein
MLSVTKVEKCPCCSSENIVKNGFTKSVVLEKFSETLQCNVSTVIQISAKTLD